MTQRIALVAGGTGLIGGYLLHHLLEDTTYSKITALVRRPLEIAHPKLAAPTVDFDRLDEALGLLRATDIFCCLGTTIKQAGSRAAFRKVDHGYVVALARLARAAGARRFLMVSAIGADPRAWTFYSRVKGEAERDVAAIDYPEIHIFRPSLLLGPRAQERPGERAAITVAQALERVLVGPLRPYRAIEAEVVAKAMACAAAAQGNEDGKHIYTHREMMRLVA